MTGTKRKPKTNKFATQFTATKMLRKVNLHNPETDTEADASDEMSDDNEHDFRHFIQDAGNDDPFQEQEVNEEEYNAREAAISVPEFLDLTRSRAVAFEVVVMTKSSNTTTQPARLTKRVIPGDSDSDQERTRLPREETRQTSIRDFERTPSSLNEPSFTPASKRSKSKGTAPSFPLRRIMTKKKQSAKKAKNKVLRKRDRVAGEMGSSDSDSSTVTEQEWTEETLAREQTPVPSVSPTLTTRTTRATSRSAAESRSNSQVRTRSKSRAGDLEKE